MREPGVAGGRSHTQNEIGHFELYEKRQPLREQRVPAIRARPAS